MLSVLIPVFNWDIRDLVQELHSQCTAQNVEFEILALDDFSTNSDQKKLNYTLNLPNFSLLELKENVGNAEARNILARTAKNNWLLFLDADMIPAQSNFVEIYLQHIQKNDFDVISGGILYKPTVSDEFKLKWLHGTKTEQQTDNKDPYLEIRGNNFLIRKEIFLQNPFGGLPESYGYVDTHFGLKLKKSKARVKIINNPCIHLGLETNLRFVQKYETALRNAYWMMKNQPELAENLRIVQTFKKFQKLHLTGIFVLFFEMTSQILLRNLHSKNPSLFIFQLYKLGYFSEYHSKSK